MQFFSSPDVNIFSLISAWQRKEGDIKNFPSLSLSLCYFFFVDGLTINVYLLSTKILLSSPSEKEARCVSNDRVKRRGKLVVRAIFSIC